ncbi:Hypothetical protein NocV09_00702390 [Nannochloropsis oceanica]
MSMEEHTLSDSGNSTGSLHDVTDNDASNANAAMAAAAAEEEEGTQHNSSQNVIPTDSLANGLSVAKGLFTSGWSQAKKGLTQMQESETMAKVREASKPLVGAVVEGGKVVGEKLHQSAEAAKPGLEAVGRRVSGAVESLAEKTKPALEKAGDAIKTTTKHVVDEGKPIVKKVGTFINHNMGGKSEGGGRGDPPTTV